MGETKRVRSLAAVLHMTTVRSGLVHIILGFWHAEQSEDACFESKSSAIIGFSA